jgi:hypothetical protein
LHAQSDGHGSLRRYKLSLRKKRFDRRPLIGRENAVPIEVRLLPDDLV